MISDSLNGVVLPREATSYFTVSATGENLTGCSMAIYFKRGLSQPDIDADIRKLSTNGDIDLSSTSETATGIIAMNPDDYLSLPAMNDVRLQYAVNIQTQAGIVLHFSRGFVIVRRSAMLVYPS